jgi:hypothetical protein
MKTQFCAVGKCLILALALALCGAIGRVNAAEVDVTQVTLAERWITNLIEIRRPTNLFVEEYRTNWVERTFTNFVDYYVTNRVERTMTKLLDVYTTNWINRTLTNEIALESVRTNFVTAYQTNWTSAIQTNWETVMLTNWTTVSQTNWKTLNLTNWEAVVVMKTNWVAQPVTNVVEIEVPTNHIVVLDTASAGSPRTAEEKPAFSEVQTPAPSPTLTDALHLDAVRTGRAATRDQAEVRLTVRWADAPSAGIRVQQWRVEREDGAVLSFAQGQEFLRELPFGRYKVEVRAQRDEASPLLAARGYLVLSATDVLFQPRRAGR